jgi:mevalonate kinase
MQVKAPGKLILSGEHAVVYGRPALAMAVNRYATVTMGENAPSSIALHLRDLAHRSELSRDRLHRFKERIKQKYQRFLRGEYTIRKVLRKPFELAQFALGLLSEALPMQLPDGTAIHVQSNIPMGCGMGSSAATILCVMVAVSRYLQIPLSKETLFELALVAERAQHGHSTGLDLQVIMQGGCLYSHGETKTQQLVPHLPLYLIQTGSPANTTGECVERVASHFQSPHLGDDFEAVTNNMSQALMQQDWLQLKEQIQHNHRLLSRIGVVPERVCQFITEVENIGGAAKICGAGAITGDQAGAVLAFVDDEVSLKNIAARFHYSLEMIACEPQGVMGV